MTNINHHENTFQREEDSAECIVRSDAVRWMDAQHQTFIDSFVKKGQMPPGVVFLTALVNEGYHNLSRLRRQRVRKNNCV